MSFIVIIVFTNIKLFLSLTTIGLCVAPCSPLLIQMSDCAYTMLLLVLFIRTIGAEEDTLCEMLGSPEFPLLSKDGDITIGGVFSIHSQISKPLLSFIDTPESLICSRYSLFFPFSFTGL